MQRPLVIAVTGGAGAGKSTASARFAQLGAAVIDADLAAREALESPAVRERLVEAFGPRVMDADGVIDRTGLADAAFSGPQSLARLDAITHPVIADIIGRELDEIFEEGVDEIVVLDIPLVDAVPEIARRCDVVVAIEAPRGARIERLARRGLTEADARRRIALQPSDVQRRVTATAVVVNDADEASFLQRLDSVWEHFVGPVGLSEGWYVEESKSP